MQATDIRLHQASKKLDVTFDNGKTFCFGCHFLRAHSPSAEVRGHSNYSGPDAADPEVNIQAIEPVGHYGIRLVFDDAHATGIYTFDYLYALGEKLNAAD